ncbi:hypothetical protein [Streptomyces sp. NPDC047706]|uniref:hypothetical protein n=1 Tax=Streptomyces sp. NPDC047706 TaxID=3365486 RepID=UPI00371A3D54
MRAESSPAARRGAFVVVAAALSCLRLDFFLALNLAVRGVAGEFGVIAPADRRTGGTRIARGVGGGVLPVHAPVITHACSAAARARAPGAVLGIGGVGPAPGPFAGGGCTEEPEAAYDASLRAGGAVMPASAGVPAGRHRYGAAAGAAPLEPRAPQDGRLP